MPSTLHPSSERPPLGISHNKKSTLAALVGLRVGGVCVIGDLVHEGKV